MSTPINQVISQTNNWVKDAATEATKQLTSGNIEKVAELVTDVVMVYHAYADSLMAVVPKGKVLTPFPKNFWNQLAWIGQNVMLLNALFGQDLFAPGREAAAQVAAKWGWQY